MQGAVDWFAAQHWGWQVIIASVVIIAVLYLLGLYAEWSDERNGRY